MKVFPRTPGLLARPDAAASQPRPSRSQGGAVARVGRCARTMQTALGSMHSRAVIRNHGLVNHVVSRHCGGAAQGVIGALPAVLDKLKGLNDGAAFTALAGALAAGALAGGCLGLAAVRRWRTLSYSLSSGIMRPGR